MSNNLPQMFGGCGGTKELAPHECGAVTLTDGRIKLTVNMSRQVAAQALANHLSGRDSSPIEVIDPDGNFCRSAHIDPSQIAEVVSSPLTYAIIREVLSAFSLFR